MLLRSLSLGFLLGFGAISPIAALNLPPQALKNIVQTPACATACIFDGKWAAKYAPECNGPPSVEQGACLCRTYLYQHMMDFCIKDKCNDEDRRRVFSFYNGTDKRLVNWGRVHAMPLEYLSNFHPGSYRNTISYIHGMRLSPTPAFGNPLGGSSAPSCFPYKPSSLCTPNISTSLPSDLS